MKLNWKVQPAPTGRYRSFESRGWPTAEFANGDHAAHVYCEDEYVPRDVAVGSHRELRVVVADWSVTPWKGRTLVARPKTLAEAKALVQKFFDTFPDKAST